MNWVQVGRDVPLLLPMGSLEEGRPYLLEVGPDFDNFLERRVLFEGDAPRLEHSFAEVAAMECPFQANDSPEEREHSNRIKARARAAGAREILRARTE